MPDELQDDKLQEVLDALRKLYDSLPRYSCKADAPDGCPVCVARSILKRESQ